MAVINMQAKAVVMNDYGDSSVLEERTLKFWDDKISEVRAIGSAHDKSNLSVV